MLPIFTELLRDFLVRHLIVPRDRVFLGPPDQTFVAGLPAPGASVNVYLADLRENRKLRTNERFRQNLPSGSIREDPYPAWLDAHYLVSAWDTANDPNIATLSEQGVLRDISSALLSGDPLTSAEVYRSPDPSEVPGLVQAFGVRNEAALRWLFGTQLGRWPEEFRVPGLPYQVLPPEGFPNLSYFWTTMGQGAVWRPVVYLIASVPLVLAQGPEYALVTTMTTVTGQTDDATGFRITRGTGHPWHQIGGQVRGPRRQPDGTIAVVPIASARVTLQLPGDPAADPPRPPVPVREVRTDDAGRYRFVFAGDAPAGPLAPFTTPYEVVVRYPGLQADPRAVDLNPTTPLAHDVVLRPAS